jgi:hypothetical protein
MFFNADGTIQKVTPTSRGVGLTSANGKIEIDRYSVKSDSSVTITLLDTLQPFNGWKTIMNKKNDWIQYNSVDFGIAKLKSVQVNASAKTGGTVEFRLDKTDGPLLAEVKIKKGEKWGLSNAKIADALSGVHNIIIISKHESPVEIDWVKFE